MSVSNRVGQVWEWGGRLILIVAPPISNGSHCDSRVNEHMHPILYLEDLGHMDGVFERPGDPWEGWDHTTKRIA